MKYLVTTFFCGAAVVEMSATSLQLRKLQLQSFKSYGPALTTIDCLASNGLTALIGKNGCGKSAVIDAVLWLFGESGKALRTSSTKALVNRQLAGEPDFPPMSVKLFFSGTSTSTVAEVINPNGSKSQSDTDSKQGQKNEKIHFFSVSKVFDGERSSLFVETFEDADFSAGGPKKKVKYQAMKNLLMVTNKCRLSFESRVLKFKSESSVF